MDFAQRFPEIVEAVVEIPAGSRNKYEFDEHAGVFRLDLDQAVRRDVDQRLHVRVQWIAHGDAQHLEVVAVLVAHREPADRPRPHPAPGERGLGDQQQHVAVVAVIRPRPLGEAIVEVVVDSRR